MICPSCRSDNDDSATACLQCGALFAAPTAVIVSIDLSTGATFHNRYQILGPLGRGGMGMVYRARDLTLDETVAIKVLRPDFAQDPKMAERFKSEIKLARKVRHRNVCAIHDYGEDRGLLYISMELIEGVDLKHVLRERGALPPAEAYEVAIQVAEGLQAVHDAGIVHRDLKTPNIMVDPNGIARLMDFGIAKSSQASGGASTATGHVLGTPEYMSPEQAQGKRVDARADVYALGVVIYEIFTGQVPFRGDTPISTILKHLHDAPPLDVARLPRELRPLLRRALAKSPDERYGSAREVAEALRDARDPSRRQVPLGTEAMEAPTLPQPPARRRMQPWLLVVPIAAGVAGVLLLRPSDRPHAPAPSPTLAVLIPAATLPAALPTSPAATLAAAPVATTEPTQAPGPTPRPTPRSAVVSPQPRLLPPAATATPAPTLPPAPAIAAAAEPPPTTLPATGLVQVAVRPWAEVSLDGKVVGTTPLDRIALAVGDHVVKLRHPAYEPLQRTIGVRAGETTKLVVDLTAEGVAKKP